MILRGLVGGPLYFLVEEVEVVGLVVGHGLWARSEFRAPRVELREGQVRVGELVLQGPLALVRGELLVEADLRIKSEVPLEVPCGVPPQLFVHDGDVVVRGALRAERFHVRRWQSRHETCSEVPSVWSLEWDGKHARQVEHGFRTNPALEHFRGLLARVEINLLVRGRIYFHHLAFELGGVIKLRVFRPGHLVVRGVARDEPVVLGPLCAIHLVLESFRGRTGQSSDARGRRGSLPELLLRQGYALAHGRDYVCRLRRALVHPANELRGGKLPVAGHERFRSRHPFGS